jgi:uncharacterized protein YdeI (BOF family)
MRNHLKEERFIFPRDATAELQVKIVWSCFIHTNVSKKLKNKQVMHVRWIGNIFLCNIKTIQDIKFQRTKNKL